MTVPLSVLVLVLSLVLVGCGPAGDAQPSPTPADVTPAPPAETPDIDDEEEIFQIGQTTYSAQCAVCHQENGQGIPGTYPALAGDAFVVQDDPEPLVMVVLNGRGGMPSFRELPDHEIAAVVSYIRNMWGNGASIVTPDEVAALR